jgi:hypothetical protein
MHTLTPPKGLNKRILAKIKQEKQLSILKRRLIFNGVVLTVSWVALVLAAKAFFSAMQMSGFGTMLNLMFSDFKVVAVNFSDYTLSLIESLPIISMAIVAVLLLPVIGSFIKFVRYIYDIRRIYRIEKI